MQRGSTRVPQYVVFIAADGRQLDNQKGPVRSALPWGEIVRATANLNLTMSESALAKVKLAKAKETVKTRFNEARHYLHYPARLTLSRQFGSNQCTPTDSWKSRIRSRVD